MFKMEAYSRIIYAFVIFAVILKASVAQITNGVLCSTVVPALDCSLEAPAILCGSDGVTYPTKCDFAKAHCKDLSIKIDSEGPCACTPVQDPACGLLANVTCPVNIFPVCGSDGSSYMNLCAFQQAKCISPNLTMIDLGPCPTLFPPSTTTTLSVFDIICQSIAATSCGIEGPEVCGSDGITYPNGCELEKTNCNSTTPPITFIQTGAC